MGARGRWQCTATLRQNGKCSARAWSRGRLWHSWASAQFSPLRLPTQHAAASGLAQIAQRSYLAQSDDGCRHAGTSSARVLMITER
eukprot:997664-Pleurochrysis_carterae.AAC.1